MFALTPWLFALTTGRFAEVGGTFLPAKFPLCTAPVCAYNMQMQLAQSGLSCKVPALPLALSWEGKDHIFGMSIAAWPGCDNLPRLYLRRLDTFGLVDMATIGRNTIPLKG